jgi:hypothetical protein
MRACLGRLDVATIRPPTWEPDVAAAVALICINLDSCHAFSIGYKPYLVKSTILTISYYR